MATLSSVLAQIRQNESGGNYTAQNPASTASGAYQFVNGTWQSLTQQSGIGTQYATAKSAPPYVQDAVAAYALEQNPNANSSSLWGASSGRTGYPLVDNYDLSSSQLASGQQSVGGTNFAAGEQQYEVLGPNGEVVGLQYGTDPTGLPAGYSIGNPAGNGTTGGTTIPVTGSNLGADVGYVPPAATGGPEATGLSPGAASTISGVGTAIGNSISGVGKTFQNFFDGLLGSVENWVGRGFLILIGLVILALALWRIIDPDGSKTEAVMRDAAVAA